MASALFRSGDTRGRLRENSIARSCTLEADENDEIQEVRDGADIIDLTSEILSTHPNSFSHTAAFQSQPHQFQVGDILEIRGTMLGQYPVHFIKVTGISYTSTQVQMLEGLPFIRTRNMKGQLPKKHNEVCMMLHSRQQPQPFLHDQPILANVKADLVVRRRAIIITNAIYPEFAARRILQSSTEHSSGQLSQSEEDATLVCRWKWIIQFVDSNRKTRVDEESIERINLEEVLQSQFIVSEQTLRNRWRGGRHRGGSWLYNNHSVIRCDNGLSNRFVESFRHRGQKYTLFDAFSGARGVSRGAQSAGFKVTHAVDKEPAVWDTYSINFPETCLYKMSIDQFIQEVRDLPLRPDVLHMSPPCQYFSPAHTRSCAHDEENTDAILCCHELVRKLRPRLITLEETFGLKFEQHQDYFHSLVGDLTHHGYSVRWRIVELCTWGSAQTRKRLVILAAGPGERLPPFPPATHSKNLEDSLLPYNTIGKALSRIRPDDDLHDLAAVSHFTPPRPRLEFDTQIGTILTSPGNIYYPDGNRSYTLREHACLQGFPISHQFRGTKTSIKRQIGNAFPPNTVKVLYKHLEKWLLKQDGVADYSPPSSQLFTIDGEPAGVVNDSSSSAVLIRDSDVAEARLSSLSSTIDHSCILIDLT